MPSLFKQEDLKARIDKHFAEIEDPRVERRRAHHLVDIIVIALFGVISGADSWVGIETYGQAKEEWLKQFLELSNGIPSHDIFARVFARLDPEKLEREFRKTGALAELVGKNSGYCLAIAFKRNEPRPRTLTDRGWYRKGLQIPRLKHIPSVI